MAAGEAPQGYQATVRTTWSLAVAELGQDSLPAIAPGSARVVTVQLASKPQRPRWALAAIAAGDDSGVAIGAQIPDVTREGTECTAFEECAGLLEDGEDIDYQGASGPVDMNDTGSLASGTIGIFEYPDNSNKYEQLDTISGLIE